MYLQIGGSNVSVLYVCFTYLFINICTYVTYVFMVYYMCVCDCVCVLQTVCSVGTLEQLQLDKGFVHRELRT